jgi:hypothetical protein
MALHWDSIKNYIYKKILIFFCLVFYILLRTYFNFIRRTEHRAGKSALLLVENDPAGRVLLVMEALECFPCVRIFPGMKH